MACLYYGAYLPQYVIHELGKPKQRGLWSADLPVAADAAGLTCEVWQQGTHGVDDFMRWIKESVKKGNPVVVGLKRYPDRHKRWFCDHFVLVVGYDQVGFLLNTNVRSDGGQTRRSYENITSDNGGLSFKNKYDRYFGMAITGSKATEPWSVPVVVSVSEEDEREAQLQIHVAGLREGREYVLARFSELDDVYPRVDGSKADIVTRFRADSESHTHSEEVKTRRVAVYRCFPAH